MTPQGESDGMALEDDILFARVLLATVDKPLADQFAAYERLRGPHADKAYVEVTLGWDTQKDAGLFAFYVRSWMTTLFLWWTAASRQKRYSEDIATVDLGLS
jgi:salicylate hydroxylase